MMLSQTEQHVGAPLFESERKSRLTSPGQMTLEDAERAVAVYEQSVAAIDQHSRSTAGTVRIAAVDHVPILGALQTGGDALLHLGGRVRIASHLRERAAVKLFRAAFLYIKEPVSRVAEKYDVQNCDNC